MPIAQNYVSVCLPGKQLCAPFSPPPCTEISVTKSTANKETKTTGAQVCESINKIKEVFESTKREYLRIPTGEHKLVKKEVEEKIKLSEMLGDR